MIKSEASGRSSRGTLSRPTTASVMKMIHKLVPSSYQTKNKRKVQAKDIQKLIDKVLRYQKKTVDINKAFVKSLGDWGTDLPTSELRNTMGIFSSLLDSISVSVLEECERLAELKISLGAISQREERQKFLVSKHDTLQAKLAQMALDNGPQACQTMLCVDEIEENEYNLKLIEQQLARTATQNLSKSCGEFLKWVKTTNTEVMRLSHDLAQCIEDPRLGNYEKDFKIEFKDYKITQNDSKLDSKPEIPIESPIESSKLDSKLENPIQRSKIESPKFSENPRFEGYSHESPFKLQIQTQYRDLEKGVEKSMQSPAAPRNESNSPEQRNFPEKKVSHFLAKESNNLAKESKFPEKEVEFPEGSHFRGAKVNNREYHFGSPEVPNGESHFRISDSQINKSEFKNGPTNFGATNFNSNFGASHSNFQANYAGSADYNSNFKANFKSSESVQETSEHFEELKDYDPSEKIALQTAHKEDSTTLVYQEAARPARTRQDTLDSPIMGHVPILETSREKISEFDIRNYEQNIEGWGNHRF